MSSLPKHVEEVFKRGLECTSNIGDHNKYSKHDTHVSNGFEKYLHCRYQHEVEGIVQKKRSHIERGGHII